VNDFIFISHSVNSTIV